MTKETSKRTLDLPFRGVGGTGQGKERGEMLGKQRGGRKKSRETSSYQFTHFLREG